MNIEQDPDLPEVSLIIPAHNEAGYIVGLLDSIRVNLINVRYEIIIVDNGSTDGTAEHLSDFQHIQLVTLTNKVFPSVARNIGFKESNGSIIAFLDADVIVTDQWAANLRGLLSEDGGRTGYFITGCAYHISTNPSWIEEYWFEPLRKKRKNYINGGNIITNRASFEKVGGFDEALETGEDVDFCIKARNVGVEVIIDNNWVVYHEGFPKSISAFIKRESWHGKSDFYTLRALLSSKIAIATALFISFHLILAFSLFFSDLVSVVSVMAFLGIVLISMLRAVLDIPPENVKQVILSSVVSYFYFVGRSLSLWRVIKEQ